MRILPLILLTATVSGCSAGRLTLHSAEHHGQALGGSFNQGVYGFDNKNSLHVLLIEGDAASPRQAVHIKMHWSPRAGRTPIDANATNAVVHYMVFSGPSAGVYSGAGFLFPQNDPGGKSFAGDIRNATLRLLDAGEGFGDPLVLAVASGSFRVVRDDLATQRALHQLRVELRQRLGYPLLVNAD
jgi:hypothetical protein